MNIINEFSFEIITILLVLWNLSQSFRISTLEKQFKNKDLR